MEDARQAELLRRAAIGLTVHRVLALSATATVPQSASHVLVTTSGGSVTLTLPKAETMQGRVVVFKKLTAANTLTLDGDGGELIDGATTLAWTTQNLAHRLLSDGTQWWTV